MFSLSFAHLSELSKPNSAKRLTTSSYPSTFLLSLTLPFSASLILTGEISANILTDLLGDLSGDFSNDAGNDLDDLDGDLDNTTDGVLDVCDLDCDVTRV